MGVENDKAKFKSKANPIEKDLTVPGRTKRGYEHRKGTDFLPRYLRSDINKKFLDATIDQLISNNSTRRLNSYYGSKIGLVNNPQQNFYEKSSNKLKEDYRFTPGIVTNNADDTTQVHITYDDIINRLEFLGGDVDNLDQLFQDTNYIWRPIVNPNKLVNFSEYYWFALDLPLATIDGTFNPSTIAGGIEFTVPAYNSKPELTLQNGMLISMGPVIQAAYPGVYSYVDENGITQSRKYIVEGVGDSIRLIDTTYLSKKTPYTPKVPVPWDNVAWDTTGWDSSVDVPGLKEYIVMERGAVDGNAWSRINCWYHIDCIKAVYEYNGQVLVETDLNDLQAIRPIIEFHKDYKLYNHGDFARSNVVGFITDSVWLNSFIGSSTINKLPDNVTVIKDGAKILVKDTNTQYDNQIWEINGIGSNVTLTVVNDSRAASQGAGPTLGDKTLNIITGYEMYYNGTKWVLGQQKERRNQAALFDLLDYQGNYLSNELTYPNSNFTGNKVFYYVENTNGVIDSELGFSVMYNNQSSPANANNVFANMVFRFDQEYQTYKYNLADTADDIKGYYYVGTNATGWDDFGSPTTPIKVNNGWERSNTVNRTPLVENITVGNETSLTIDLKTESWGGSLDNQVEYEIVDTDDGYQVRAKTKYTNYVIRGKNPDIFIARDQATSISYRSGITNPVSFVDVNNAVYSTGGVIQNPSPMSNNVFSILPTASDPNLLKYTGNLGEGRIYIIDKGTQTQFPEVYYNGKLAIYGIDWDIQNDAVVLPLNNGIRQKRIVELKPNDIIDVVWISDEAVTNPTYAQNSSFVANPKNDTVGDITFTDYFDHFTTVIGNHNGFKGDRFGKNNFENLVKQPGVAGKIQQHENNVLLYGPLFGSIDNSPVNALRYTGDQVDRFRRRFKQTAKSVFNSTPAGTPAYEIVDRTLAVLNMGKDSEFPYAYSNMAFSTNFTEQDEIGDGTKTVYDLNTPVELGDFGQHVYVYVNDQQQTKNFEYTVTNTQVTFLTAPALNDTIKFRVANKDALTLIPITLAKLGLGETYGPLYYNGTPVQGNFSSSDPFILYHDGSLDFDVSEYDEINLAVVELEKRIYNYIAEEFKEDILIDTKVFSGPNKTTYADGTLIRAMAEERFNSWLSSRGYTATDRAVGYNNKNYSASNKFEWNYATTTIVPTSPGYWRGMYMYFFGAYEPAITPWRCLGHADKPSWWDTYYPSSANLAWALTDPKRIAYNEALRTGNTANPATGVSHNPEYARGQYVQYLPVDPATGLTIDPVAAGLATTPTPTNAAKAFTFGDHYGLELDWRRSSRYRFDILEIELLLTPGTILREWNTKAHTTSLAGERVRIDTLKRPTPKDLDIHRYVENSVMTTSYGFNHLLSENLMSKNLNDFTQLKTDIERLDTKLMFKLEGFTDKNTVRLVTDSISQTSDRFVPEEDFDIALYQSPPLVNYDISAVTVTWDGEGYQVAGRNNVDPYFIIEPSLKTGNSIDVTVGNTTVTKYLKGDGSTQQIDYGHRFLKRSDVYDFFVSYNRYLEKQGWIMDRTSNFALGGENFIEFSNVLLDVGDNIEIAPFKTGIEFSFDGKGFIGNTQTLINEVYNLKDEQDKEVRSDAVDITRLDGTMKITPIGEQQLFYTRLYTTEYDHVIYMSQKTVFNDTLYDPILNIMLERIKFIGQRTADWTGVPKADGYVLNNDRLITNFEKSVNDVDRGYFDVEDTVLNETTIDAARHNIGYVTQDYLKNNLFNKDVSFEFWKGLIHKKGTPSAYNNLLRSINIDNDVRDIDVQEEWMLKLGEYGGLAVTQNYEVELPAGNVTHNPQVIAFEKDIRDDRVTNKDLEFDTKITITANDPRWVRKPDGVGVTEFPTMSTSKLAETKQLTAGLAFETEVEYSLFETEDLEFSYINTVQPGSIPIWRNGQAIQAGEYVRYNGQVYISKTDTDGNGVNEANVLEFEPVDEPILPTYWIAKHSYNGKTDPNVLKAQDFTFAITEICAGLTESDKALVKCDKAHGLAVGDKVLIVNSTTQPIVDGIYTVQSIETDNWFLIDAFINVKGQTGKFFPLREMMWDTKAELDALLTDPKYNLRSGDYGYTADAVYRYNASTNAWSLVRQATNPIDNSALKDVKIYDSDKNKIIAQFEALDPRKGLIPGTAQREIAITNPYDISKYNSSNDDNKRLDERRYWASSKVGTVWWDTSTAIYQNPEQELINDTNKEYKYTHWGKLHPSASIDIYEWSRSVVSPDQWENNGYDGTPYFRSDENGVKLFYWSEDFEYDKTTGQQKKYFYFWVKNRTVVPSMKNIDRKLSGSAIAALIQNPTEQGVLWASAPSTNDLLIGNADKVLLDENSVLEFYFKQQPQTNHSEYYLVRENDTIEIIPKFFHERLKASLVGRQFADTTVDYQVFNTTTNYSFGEYVQHNGKFYRALSNNSAGTFVQGNWEEIYNAQIQSLINTRLQVRVRRLVPDLREHPFSRYGINPRPAQSWFKDVDGARRVFVQKANELLLPINLVDTVIDWDRLLRQTAFAPLNGKPGVTFDITKYWYYVNWKADNWVSTVPEKDVADFVALQQETPTDGRVVRVLDDGTGRYEIWLGDGQFWNLIEKQNATIQLSDKLWDTSIDESAWDQGPWDSDAWDEYPQTELFIILDTLRYDVFKDNLKVNYNKIWFSLLYFTFTDQEQVDWAVKTTYLQVKISERGDAQANVYNGDGIENIIKYINSVKPFRTKLRNVFNVKNILDETVLTIEEESRNMKVVLKFDRHGEPCWNQTLVDGANFFVLEPGYDVAPWDGTYQNLHCDPETSQRPWDADRQTLENLYLKDIYDGNDFALPRNPVDDIQVEGDRFIHPEYEGYPEEQVNVLPFDAVSIRVETNKVGTPTVTAGPTYSVNSEETGPRGITFNNDGTKMFVVGTTGDDVNEYTLSTGFDLSSTVTFIDSFPVPQCPNPMSIKFNPDGTKMFVTGVGNNNVHEYALTTGFDVSTAGFTQTLVTTVDNDNFGLDFKPDGTKMWITGDSNNKIYEFNLSTGFDISTATFNQDLSMTAYDVEPFGIEWSTDGKRLFVIGTRGNGVDEWRASTPWDISTITHVGFYHIGGNPSGIHFSPNGYKMFILGNSSDLVKSYTLSDPYRLIGLDQNIPSSTTLSFHMFKDMMGDFHITRASSLHTTWLDQDLNKGDTQVHVGDASKLTQPDVVNNVPGVVWIGPERIEFWGVDGNTLIDIQRSTLGTPEVNHPRYIGSNDGSIVLDGGRESQIPGIARYVNYGEHITPAYNNFSTPLHTSTTPEAQFIQAEPGQISSNWVTNNNPWTA